MCAIEKYCGVQDYKLFAKGLVLLCCELALYVYYSLCFSFLCELNVQFVLLHIKPLPLC